MSVHPSGVVAQTIDPYGHILTTQTEPIAHLARTTEVRRAVVKAGRRACAGAPARLAVVSAADPVDRTTGRLVHLPDAPFLVGELSPAEALAGIVTGPVTVDNDVNWAARAERDSRSSTPVDDFVYLYLGEGLGLAVVSDGEVRRGHSGIAGEIAHLLTTGPNGRAAQLTDVFAALDLRLPDSTAIDVPALLQAVARQDAHGRRVLKGLALAVTGVLAATVALLDPAFIVIGGPWGDEAVVRDAIDGQFREMTRHAPIEPARCTVDGPLTGARTAALVQLREAIISGSAAGSADS